MNENKKIRVSSKRTTKKENSEVINETEAILNQLELLSFTEDKSFDEPTSFRNSKYTLKHGGTKELINNFYSNIPQQNQKKVEKINNNNENKNNIPNKECDEKKELLQIKLDNILTTIRLSEIKINIKYYNSLLKFKDYFKDNAFISNNFHHFNDLFNVIIELLFVIKKEYEKNEMNNNKNNKNGIIMKLEKEINYKDKQIGELLNKLQIEQQKVEKNSKDNINELISLKKENRELNSQITLFKNHIKKIDTNNLILEEKLNNIILDKINKRTPSSSANNKVNSEINTNTINMNNNININNYNGIHTHIQSSDNIFKESIKNEIIYNNKKNNKNEKASHFRKLNISLIKLLKEINKILGVYDLSLNKINNDDTQTNIIINLNNMIDLNILIDEEKMDNFYKNLLGNMDKILKKIDKLIDINKKNNLKKTHQSKVSSEKKSSSVIKRNKNQLKDQMKLVSKTSEKQRKYNIIQVNRKIISSIKDVKIT